MTFPQSHTLADFGGVLNDLSPITDPTTDRPAAGANAAYGSVAAMTRVSGRAWVLFSASPTATTLVAHGAAWPTTAQVTPTLSRSSAGVYVISWPATVTDETGLTQTVSLAICKAITFAGTTPYAAAAVVTGRSATVYVTTLGGAAVDPAGNIYVEVG